MVENLGEVLKVLKEVKLGDSKFLIEQRDPFTKQGSRVIYLHDEKFRIEMTEPEFLELAGAIAYARRNFESMKGWKAV